MLAVGVAVAPVAILAACATGTKMSAEASRMADQLTVASPAFAGGGAIPRRHTCDGEDVSPPLAWTGAPEGATAYALVVDDPDARGWVHWLVSDIPGSTTEVQEGAAAGVQGRNDFGRNGWGGPCPPSGTHRYDIRVFALSEPLGLAEGFSADELRTAMEGKVLADGRLSATYRRGG